MVIPQTLPVYLYNHPILRQKSTPLLEMTDDVRKFCVDFLHTMLRCKGIGMAANQVGFPYSIIAVDTTDRDSLQRGTIFINPEITWNDGIYTMGEEGCLSLPSIKVQVSRWMNIEVKYLDINMQERVYKTNKLYYDEPENADEQPSLNSSDIMLARVIQHEMEHLNGGLIIDHVKEMDDALKHKLSKLERGHVNTKYASIYK